MQGFGTSRGGRTSKIHSLTDANGRPRVLLISPGNTSDMTMTPALIEAARGRFDKLVPKATFVRVRMARLAS